MENRKIDVLNYLDMHATVNNKQVEVFSIGELKNEFPELEELSLKKIESEWRAARQRMLDIKFDD